MTSYTEPVVEDGTLEYIYDGDPATLWGLRGNRVKKIVPNGQSTINIGVINEKNLLIFPSKQERHKALAAFHII